jgi:hypothetical protein
MKGGQSTYLEIDSETFLKPYFHLGYNFLGMTIKDVEMTDSVFSKKLLCHRAMELPHFAIRIEHAGTEHRVHDFSETLSFAKISAPFIKTVENSNL